MGIGNAPLEQFRIIGEDVAAFAATGNGDVKLFAVDGPEGVRGGDQKNVIDGFALGSVGGDGVAVAETPVLFGQGAANGERL